MFKNNIYYVKHLKVRILIHNTALVSTCVFIMQILFNTEFIKIIYGGGAVVCSQSTTYFLSSVNSGAVCSTYLL